MEVVIGSNNKPKRNAVENSFKAAFPTEEITIETISTNSGVSAHPTSGEESIKGALTRMAQAKELIADADYYVGIEGGLLRSSGRAWEIGWIAINDSSGKIATGLSAGIELRGKILDAITDGIELNEVLENDFGIQFAGDSNGFYGLATNDLTTRQAAYEQGVTFALASFLHPEFYSD